MKKFLKLFTLTILCSSLLALPVNAQISYDDANGEHNISGGEGDSYVQDVDVTVSKGATFRVVAPKKITVSPNIDTTYSIGVYADIGSNQCVVVEPMDTSGDGDSEVNFMLVNSVNSGITAKDSVKAKVTPIKTKWLSDDANLISDMSNVSDSNYHTVAGSVKANVSAGQWSGSFVLRIALEDV